VIIKTVVRRGKFHKHPARCTQCAEFCSLKKHCRRPRSNA